VLPDGSIRFQWDEMAPLVRHVLPAAMAREEVPAVEKAAPRGWSLQRVVRGWYRSAGQELPEAEALREGRGEGDREWSLRPRMAVLRRAIVNAAIEPLSGEPADLWKLGEALKNCVNLAA
jgi:hypothetical protein